MRQPLIPYVRKLVMKKILLTLLALFVLASGAGLLFYPDISNWYNSRIHTGLVQAYNEEIARMGNTQIEEHFRRAREHNEALIGGHRIADPFSSDSAGALPSMDYLEILNVGGMMAQIEIPAINVRLPVFHTTRAAVLERGVGHIEATSFPVGGKSTHAALTGHSALPHSKIFTDLEELVVGDLFFITVLNQMLAYEVDQITVTLPHETQALRIVEDADYITLITCTPYAINTHRLLVRGTRIPYEAGMEHTIEPVAEENMDWRVIVLIVLAVIFLLLLVIFKLKDRRSDFGTTRKDVRHIK